MQRQCIVIRRIIHNKQGMVRNVGKQLLTEPFTKKIMIHLAVIISRFPCAFEHQFGVGYPAVLRHRMHNNEPLAFPCWFLHPRPIFLPVPDKIIAMVLLLSLGKQSEPRGMRAQTGILRGPVSRLPIPVAHSSAPSRYSCGSHKTARLPLGSENTPRSSGAASPCECLVLPGCYQRAP